MSVVCNVVTTTSSWLVSDGRGINGSVLTDNVQKYRMINSRLCVGFTGVLEVALSLIDRIQRSSDAEAVANCRSDEYASFLHEVVQRSGFTDSLYANFVVTGPNRSGQMASYTIKFGEPMQSHIPQHQKELKCISLLPDGSFPNFPEFIKPHVSIWGINRQMIVNAMKAYISKIAETEISVNTHFDFVEISL